jgi:NAD(P)-dependent dehydrogenase (short-subunit alcohol dehydrogenase family)
MNAAFGIESTADDVLAATNLDGKRILITGASTVLEVETIRTLASRGAHVTGAELDLDKARAALAAVEGATDLVPLDLGSLASVRACADAVLERGDPLDLLICNSGLVACPKSLTVDGLERQLAFNHLGHFLLVNRLAPLLRPGSRVVILSSPGHRFADVDLDDPNFDRTAYDPWIAYGRASTAKILFGVEFDRRHRERGVRAAVANPGAIRTELSKHVTSGDAPPNWPTEWKTIAQGAATTVWAGLVADPDTVGGRYCEDCGVAAVTDDREARTGVQRFAVDPERARALWSMSETLIGESF